MESPEQGAAEVGADGQVLAGETADGVTSFAEDEDFEMPEGEIDGRDSDEGHDSEDEIEDGGHDHDAVSPGAEVEGQIDEDEETEQDDEAFTEVVDEREDDEGADDEEEVEVLQDEAFTERSPGGGAQRPPVLNINHGYYSVGGRGFYFPRTF